ncbi:MAG: alpha-ribazole phosphatase [Bacteroidetes bacterium]|nr:alpha-ribazole phosphatase [Bacteroidota bacterium]
MQVYLIRHTEVSVSDGLCYGKLDVPLKENFLEDFIKIRNKLPVNIEKVLTSPSSRCVKLANYLNDHPVLDRRLLEMNFGDWEGKHWSEIDAQSWFDDYVNQPTPDGESFVQLYHRVQSFLMDLRELNGKSVVIITHAGVIRCILALILNVPLEHVFKLKIHFGQVITMEINDNPALDMIDFL